MILFAFVAGIFIGGVLGVLALALAIIVGRGDK